MSILPNGISTVVITGAGRGIGKAIALRFGELGVHVVCISKTQTAHETRDAILAKQGSAHSVLCDLADYEHTKLLMTEIAAQYKEEKIGLILAAAIIGPTGPTSQTNLTQWDETHRVNVLGNLAVYQAFIPHMCTHKFGRIIFFSGGGGAFAFPTFPAYAASKAAIIRIVENIHEDLQTHGDFAVVALSPGAIDTDMLRAVKQKGVFIQSETHIEKPVYFAEKFIQANTCQFSGRLVHANDDWEKYLNTTTQLKGFEHWKLRRQEN